VLAFAQPEQLGMQQCRLTYCCSMVPALLTSDPHPLHCILLSILADSHRFNQVHRQQAQLMVEPNSLMPTASKSTVLTSTLLPHRAYPSRYIKQANHMVIKSKETACLFTPNSTCSFGEEATRLAHAKRPNVMGSTHKLLSTQNLAGRSAGSSRCSWMT
jgi:hypothetical protein